MLGQFLQQPHPDLLPSAVQGLLALSQPQNSERIDNLVRDARDRYTSLDLALKGSRAVASGDSDILGGGAEGMLRTYLLANPKPASYFDELRDKLRDLTNLSNQFGLLSTDWDSDDDDEVAEEEAYDRLLEDPRGKAGYRFSSRPGAPGSKTERLQKLWDRVQDTDQDIRTQLRLGVVGFRQGPSSVF